MQYLSKAILKLLGFRVTGNIRDKHKKKITVVVPHTSNWDFPLGLLVKSSIGMKANYIGKNSLFKPPFGWIFKALGGIPVDRSKSSNTVKSIVEAFRKSDEMNIAIAPEGTRKKVKHLKRGFYYIAKSAEIPIILVKFDYKNKEVHFSEPYFPTEDEAADWLYLENYWNGIEGKIPEKSYGYNRTFKS